MADPSQREAVRLRRLLVVLRHRPTPAAAAADLPALAMPCFRASSRARGSGVAENDRGSSAFLLLRLLQRLLWDLVALANYNYPIQLWFARVANSLWVKLHTHTSFCDGEERLADSAAH